jgi:hypothetical protein
MANFYTTLFHLEFLILILTFIKGSIPTVIFFILTQNLKGKTTQVLVHYNLKILFTKILQNL